MSVITGIQRRVPDAHSTHNYANYDNFVECAGFAVRRQNGDGEKLQVSVFFPRSGTPEQTDIHFVGYCPCNSQATGIDTDAEYSLFPSTKPQSIPIL